MWSKISNSKVFYVVLSIVCAIAFWLYVDVVQEVDKEVSIYNIPVTFIGEDILAEEGLMITSGKDTTVNMTISGPRSVVSQLSRSNVTITVQAATQISGEGHYDLYYSTAYPGSNTLSSQIVDSSVDYISVDVVQMTSKTVDIVGRFTGSVEEGVRYDQNDFQFEVSQVTVSGERSQVELVDHAEVELTETGLNATWTGTLAVVLKDADGNDLDPASMNITCDTTEVYTRFPVQFVKEVPLTVEIAAGGGATENNIIERAINPKTVTISGTQEALDAIDSISLGTIDLSEIVTTDVKTFTIPVPDGITILSGITTATVTITVDTTDKLSIRTVVVDAANIRFVNVPDGLNVDLITQSMTVRIRGASELVDELVMDSDVYVQVDLSNLDVAKTGTGTQTLDAAVVVQGFADVGAVGSYQVIANITKS